MKLVSKNEDFLIITGLSGSGKTVFSRFLEDMGYYCVDNLPAKLIPSFVDLWRRKEVEIEKVALVVDMREPGFLTEFPRVWEGLRKKFSPRLIFLDSSDETLVKRFSESRRPHPLTKKGSIIEGVRLERKRLSEIKRMADEVIDTSTTNIPQLREFLARRYFKRKNQRMQIMVVSFGYKYGIPLDSDLVFDTRFLPNPFYIDRLKDKTGKGRQVRDYVLKSEDTEVFLEKLYGFVEYLIPKFIAEGKSYLKVSIGCTGGRHRSVVVAEELKGVLHKLKFQVRVHHRDILK